MDPGRDLRPMRPALSQQALQREPGFLKATCVILGDSQGGGPDNHLGTNFYSDRKHLSWFARRSSQLIRARTTVVEGEQETSWAQPGQKRLISGRPGLR